MLINLLKPNKKLNEQSESMVLLSHSSENNLYGDAIRELLITSGLPNNILLYSSHEMNGIPAGNNIFDFLRNTLDNKKHAIFLLSDEYFHSAACLNEMGAIWMNHNKYTKLFLPNFDVKFSSYLDCCIDSQNKGIILNRDRKCRVELVNFAKEILNENGVKTQEDIIQYAVDKCCETLRSFVPKNRYWKSEILEVKERAGYLFGKLDVLVPTGNVFMDHETHWVQLKQDIKDASSMKVGSRVQFKISDITNFEKDKYGTQNFRNIYIYPKTFEIIG